MSRANLLFPVEQINRELDFRLVLASLCASPSNRIFIGSPDAIIAAATSMRGGLYVGKNVFYDKAFPDADMSHYRLLKGRGFNLVWLDEEGGLYVGEESRWHRILARHIDPRFLDSSDTVCAWGPFQGDFYRSLSPSCAVVDTGHPRFDLMKPRYNAIFSAEATKIRERYGDFILINTNRTIANNGLGIEDTFSPIVGYDVRDVSKRADFLNLWAHSSRVFISLVHLANSLSVRFPRIRVVIRPHPSEDHNFYKVVFRGVDNILVSHEGGVSPWLMASRMLIHNGCTTAIEAYLAGKPVVSYVAFEDARFDCRLPNRAGIQCPTEEAVFSAVESALNSNPLPQMPTFGEFDSSRMLYDFKSDAFERLRGVIDAGLSRLRLDSCSFDSSALALNCLARRGTQLAKSIVRPFFPHKEREFRFHTSKGHFYGFSQSELSAKFAEIQKMTGASVEWKLHSWDLLSVTKG